MGRSAHAAPGRKPGTAPEPPVEANLSRPPLAAWPWPDGMNRQPVLRWRHDATDEEMAEQAAASHLTALALLVPEYQQFGILRQVRTEHQDGEAEDPAN